MPDRKANLPPQLVTIAAAHAEATKRGFPISRRTVLRLVHDHGAGVRLRGRIFVDYQVLVNEVLVGEKLTA